MKCHVRRFFIFLFLLFATLSAKQLYIDEPFEQDVHIPFAIEEDAANDVTTVHVDQAGHVWAGTPVGVYLLEKGEKHWRSMTPESERGPVYDIISDSKGVVWIGAWDGVYRGSKNGIVKTTGIDVPVAALCETDDVIGFGPDGLWKINKKLRHESLKSSRAVRAALADQKGGFWLATGMGLYRVIGDQWRLFQSQEELLTPALADIAFDSNGDLWAGGLGGVSVLCNNFMIRKITPKDGLPSSEVQCIERAPDGTMWIGTKLGIARIVDGQSSVRHSRRWLLDDDVRDISFDAAGTAWIATGKGVSAIKKKSVTLADKDAVFHRICLERHQREPGIVERCFLDAPGDTANWRPRDDDNDGQYTAMYLAMESYRYAVTKSDKAKKDAKKAFDLLKYLQTVTETDGFVARTVVPVSWKRMADANRLYSDREFADKRVDNPREKVIEKRWRPSSDGKWLWKGDTSSDEITGHMYGYLFYHDLAADKKEKKVVADHICKIVDYIIAGDYVLRDIDGEPTKWAIWAPRFLNDDPDWRQERGINSVEILSYLKLAWHVSGEEKYQHEYKKLLYEHNYLDNVRRAKTTNPAWRTHIDDELLALAYPALLLYEDDPELCSIYFESFEQWYAEASKDCSPYFNFMYAAFTGSDPQFECSIDFLKQTPLDLVSWQIDNSTREDVQLIRAPEVEQWQTARWLPIDEISFFRWDDNPRIANRGHGGVLESDGVFWMLPYWMGRYYGLIE